MSKYGVFSGPYFPVFRLNTGKYGREKPPSLDTFHAVFQLLTHYSLFRNFPCSNTNFLTAEAARISMALNIFGASWTIALDILNIFDKIEHTTDLLHKIKFYNVYGKMLFLIDSFLSTRKLWVA